MSASAAGSGLLVEAGAGVLSVTLDVPDRRNAQTPAMWRELARIGGSVPDDVRVVVVRGNGPSFSAGLDRRLLAPGGMEGEPDLLTMASAATTAGELDALIASFQSGFSWLRDPRFVSIAAVQGHAVGAGFQLALACDLRLVAADALLAMREPSLGLVPDLGGTQPLVQVLGYSRALELCASGRWMDADEAVRTGLALRSVPPGELAAATDDLVGSLLVAPHEAVTATKALLLGAPTRTYDEQLAAERAAQAARLAELARLLASAQG